jgi:hypothetical protein
MILVNMIRSRLGDEVEPQGFPDGDEVEPQGFLDRALSLVWVRLLGLS